MTKVVDYKTFAKKRRAFSRGRGTRIPPLHQEEFFDAQPYTQDLDDAIKRFRRVLDNSREVIQGTSDVDRFGDNKLCPRCGLLRRRASDKEKDA